MTGIRDLPAWAVEVRTADGAVTLVPPPGKTVTTREWRALPLGAVLRVADSVRQGEVLHGLAQMIASEGGDPRASSRGGRREHLARVVRVYRLALEHDIAPRELLAEVFETTEPTGQRWIAQARDAGLIDDYRDELARAKAYTPHRPRDARKDRPGVDPRTGRAPGRGSTTTTTKKEDTK
ncbi:hypothetical protein [Agromyces italicus]|uniref:hypothetical protein n=1 Tax=Agromyces italicus TaxID=279572 RepID=UPI0012F9EDBE|nr:hypothetical protein [Agromyces italicus]